MGDCVNPFNPYFPADSRIFANRGKEQRFFIQGLRQGLHPKGPGPWNVALLGPWGIGKTSLLRRFAGITSDFDRPAVPISLTVTSGLESMDAFIFLLLDHVKEILLSRRNWPARIRQELTKWEMSLQLGPIRLTHQSSRSGESVAGISLLYKGLYRLWESILHGQVSGVVIFLDDAHNLLQFNPQALLILRSVFQDLQGIGAKYPLVITGPEDMFEATRDVAEPVTRFFERMKLGLFSLEDTGEAIKTPLNQLNTGISIEDDAITVVWEKSLGHPFFLTFIMRDLVNIHFQLQRHRPITSVDVTGNWQEILAHLQDDKFNIEWKNATPAERNVLLALAVKNKEESLAGTIGKRGSGLLSRLIRKGLITRQERGSYELYHPLFKEFVLTLAKASTS
jgi:hypothetical protein